MSVVQEPVELLPVDSGFEDRSVLSESFKVQQNDMRVDTSFEKLYKVKGSDGIYVRKSGGLHAVFRNPEYLDTTDGAIPLVPAGTVYCIGSVRPELLNQLGGLATPIGLNHSEPAKPTELRIRWTPPAKAPANTIIRTIKFIDDEGYRRQRLTAFVLEIVLSS